MDDIMKELDAWFERSRDSSRIFRSSAPVPSERHLLQCARDEIMALRDVKAALQVLLDQVDYTSGACRLTEMVGAVLPKEVIALCRERLKATTP